MGNGNAGIFDCFENDCTAYGKHLCQETARGKERPGLQA